MKFLAYIILCLFLIGCSPVKQTVELPLKVSSNMKIPEIEQMEKVVNTTLKSSFPKKENLVLIYADIQVEEECEVLYSLFPSYYQTLSNKLFFEKENGIEGVNDTIDFLFNENKGQFECAELIPKSHKKYLRKYYVRKKNNLDLSSAIEDSFTGNGDEALFDNKKAFQLMLYANLKNIQIQQVSIPKPHEGGYVSVFKVFEVSEYDHNNSYQRTTRQLVSVETRIKTDEDLEREGGKFFPVNEGVMVLKREHHMGNSSSFGIVTEYFKKKEN